MSTPELPNYNDSPSLPLPSYSCQLANGEQRLDYTPGPQAARPLPSGTYVKNVGELSVVLNDQEEDVTIPIFGRRAVINGTLLLCQEQLDDIRKIVLKIEGRLDSSSSAGGRSVKLINDSYTLWSHLTPEEPCLSQIPFSITLPSTFQDGGKSCILPPSYHVRQEGVMTYLLVQSVYQLHFVITRVRHQTLLNSIWPKKQHIIIPFNYVPRARPQRPIVATPSFFSSVKTSPEEWYQEVASLKMRPSTKMDPIICHLFIPAGQIYCLSDTINFHIQLSGLRCTLYTLFSGTDLDCITPVNSVTKNKPKNQKKPFIRVSLLRQVSVMIRGESSWNNSILGQGTIWPIPPDISSCSDTTCPPSKCRSEVNIDWDGEVRCRDDITVGGFNAANVQVKDFIILYISPPTPTSPLLELSLTVPVRLVTDPFLDIVTQMDSAPL